MLRSLACALTLSALSTIPLSAAAQSSGAEFVLVRRDAHLYAAPTRDAERARDPWASRFGERLGPFFVMRFVAERGDFVEVATLPAFRPTDHCYGTVSGLDGLDVHLFVKRDALGLVVPSRVEHGDASGGFVLAGGVGLTHRGGRRYDAHVRGATLRVELDPGDVATRYRASARIPVSRGVRGMLAPGARVDFGRNMRLVAEAGRRGGAPRGGVVDFSVEDTRASRADDGPPRALLTVEPIEERGGRITAFVRNECVEVRGALARRDVTNERPPRGVSELGARHGTSLRPGTQLFWSDGSPAGRATVDAALEGAVQTVDGRSCFDHPLRPTRGRAGADDVLTLCIDRSALTAARAPRGFR